MDDRTSSQDEKDTIHTSTNLQVEAETAPARSRQGGFDRFFTHEGDDVFGAITWEKRLASITNDKGDIVFEQEGVEAPAEWSQMATNVVVSKYFRGGLGAPDRETSVRQLITRVVGTLTGWGRAQGYFDTDTDSGAFADELTYLLIHQYASFNSPVWFNCGVEERPQCSACFINSVKDTMESILELAKTEGMLFKFGSGTGTNFSSLRSSKESLAGGGTASGPVSFMRGFDAFAGVIKSGGKTRRAAKMVILNVEHPDVMEFITTKSREEKKAWALIDAGYDGSFGGEAYSSIFYQNANHSIRATDEFMEAVLTDSEWSTKAVTNGEPMDTYRAREMMRAIADGTYICGDPGMQFNTTINRWHTCSNTAPINASNPCSEYMFLDDSACNLSSLNLMRFVAGDGEIDPEAFKHAVRTMILAQEIIISNASYPTAAIERNSNDYRPLGLGYANLGALLMSRGMPYDSDEGRDYAAAITALMTGEAYAFSAVMASRMSPFAGFSRNRDPMLRVIDMHRAHVGEVNPVHVPGKLMDAARDAWDRAKILGAEYGFRNAQVSVLAPTGTIAFMMDCDTTGVEPDIALVKYKRLVGGGTLKMVNHSVGKALKRLGYGNEQIEDILGFIDTHETIEGAPHLLDEHLPVFDCALRPVNGVRSITYMGHIKMMAAVQPFISGAISKTVNMPNDATVEEIEQAYIEGWRLGLKALAIYRDGSKRTQPLTTSRQDGPKADGVVAPPKAARRRLPAERRSITHKFDVAGNEGYITVGMYDDGTPGEIFLVMAKEGSTVSGLMDSFATSISMALQYGVPLRALVDKFSHMRFEPSGMTSNPDIPIAKSMMDYIFRWLASKFLSVEDNQALGVMNGAGQAKFEFVPEPAGGAHLLTTFQTQADAPSCSECGSIMVRNGACYKCLNCGSTSGCS